MARLKLTSTIAALSAGLVLSVGAPSTAQAINDLVVHSFPSPYGGPYSRLTSDGAGNIYGTTQSSGNNGTIFELTTTGVFITLYTFHNGVDGQYPNSIFFDGTNGSLFGTTRAGGAHRDGVIF